jgi:hypothetical protein
MLSLLIPCMYFTHWDLGRLGSGLRKYKYSAICFHTPIKKLYHKDTVSFLIINPIIMALDSTGYYSGSQISNENYLAKLKLISAFYCFFYSYQLFQI